MVEHVLPAFQDTASSVPSFKESGRTTIFLKAVC